MAIPCLASPSTVPVFLQDVHGPASHFHVLTSTNSGRASCFEWGVTYCVVGKRMVPFGSPAAHIRDTQREFVLVCDIERCSGALKGFIMFRGFMNLSASAQLFRTFKLYMVVSSGRPQTHLIGEGSFWSYAQAVGGSASARCVCIVFRKCN